MNAWTETTKKMDKVQLYFQLLKEKPAYRYFFSMSDRESHGARKQMWKITSGVSIVVLLSIALKRPSKVNNLLILSVRSLQRNPTLRP